MANKTNIASNMPYNFKDNVTWLNQANWQAYFGNALPWGFLKSYLLYDNDLSKLIISYQDAVLDGLFIQRTLATDNFDPVSQSEFDCLYYFRLYNGTLDLCKATNIHNSESSAFTFLSKLLYQMSTNMEFLSQDISEAIYGDTNSIILPLSYGIYNHGFWDLRRLLNRSGEGRIYSQTVTGFSKTTPYLGHDIENGNAQIYGGSRYNITFDPSASGNFYLYPVPSCNMDPAVIYMTNPSAYPITIKIPLSYNDMTFDYIRDATWVEDDDYLTYSIAAGGELVVRLTQTYQSYPTGVDYYPKSVFEITQNDKNNDPGEAYTKAEANALFETKSDAATALADKADADDVYTKTAADALLAAKADASDTYTKSEVNTALAAKADASSVYTKTEINPVLAAKANAADVYTKSQTYTKTEVDALIEDVPVADNFYTKTETDALLADKADADDVYSKSETYTKTETDALLADKADTSDLATKADVNSPTFTGSPKAPTAASGTNTTQIATTAFVQNALAGKADLSSPTFTGDPKAPTPTSGDNSTKIATTAFVADAITKNNTGRTIYVNKSTGNDSTGNGSQSAPFKTIQKGIDSLPDGVYSTLYVAPDTYNESVTISAKNVIIRSTAGAGSVIYVRCTSGSGHYGFKITNGSNVHFYGGFTVWSNGGTIAVENGSHLRYQAYDSTVDKLRVIQYESSSGISNKFIMAVSGGSTFVAGYGQTVQTSWEGTRAQNEYGIYADEGAYVSVMNLIVGDGSDGVNAAFYNRSSVTICGTLTGSYVDPSVTQYGGIVSIGTAS